MSVVAPFELPCRARIVEFSVMDRTGELEVEGGTRIRFIANACEGFNPEVGVECWILELRPSPLRNDRLYAGVISLSGSHEPTVLEVQADEQTFRDAEAELFEELEIDPGVAGEEIEHTDLAWLSVEDQARVAAVLMEGWNAGFPSVVLSVAAEAIPEALHPYLESIDVDEDMVDVNIAWTPFLGAPAAALVRYEQMIERATLRPSDLRFINDQRLVLEVDGESLSPSVTGAMRVLIASENALAWRRVEELLAVMPAPLREEAVDDVQYMGYDVLSTGRLTRHYSGVAYELFERKKRSKDPEVGRMWGAAGAFCSHCGTPLWSILDLDTPKFRGAIPTSFGLDRLRIVTCLFCCRERGPTYFVQLGDVPFPLITTEIAEQGNGSMDPSDDNFKPMAEISVWALDGPRYAGNGNRVGGCPNVPPQDGHSHYPLCPLCSSKMTFVARVDAPEERVWGAGSSVMVAFLCALCRVVGTNIWRE